MRPNECSAAVVSQFEISVVGHFEIELFAPSRARDYLRVMTDKPKRPRDANQLAKFIVDMATEDEETVHEADTSRQREGGLKGGKARSEKLSPEERSDIAKKAAVARWKKDDK